MDRDEVIRRFDALRRAVLPGNVRAPHKPLLVLYLLGRLQQGQSAKTKLVVTYAEAERVVSPLIDQFAPRAREKHRAAMPFFYLDRSIWQLEGEGLQARHARLRDAAAQGSFAPEIEEALRRDPSLVVEIARRIIDTNFTDSYVGPLTAATGLDLEGALPVASGAAKGEKRVRSPEFRVGVLRAYRFKCAFCGFDGKAGTGLELSPIGIAAAHIHWHALGGPDEVTNGLALCDLHHTLFDRGVMGVDDGRKIMVSDDFHAESEMAQVLVTGIRGSGVHAPEREGDGVREERFEWHRKQVFRRRVG